MHFFLYFSRFQTNTDTTICTGCCSILDNIVSHIFKQLSIKGESILSITIEIKFANFFQIQCSRLSTQHSQPKNCAVTLLIRRVTCFWRWLKCIQRFCKEFCQQSSISWCLKIVKINGRYLDRCWVSFCCTRITLGMPAIYIHLFSSVQYKQCNVRLIPFYYLFFQINEREHHTVTTAWQATNDSTLVR